MTQPKSLPLTNQHALDFIRREIAHEFSLLNSRLSWFTTCQSFLITAFVISLSNPSIDKAGWLDHFLIPILGLALSIAIFPGILAAHDTIQLWLGRQYQLLLDESARQELAPVVIGRFVQMPASDRLHNRSIWFSASLPILMGLFWIVAFTLIRIIPVHPLS